MVTETESVVDSSPAVVPITSVVVYGLAEKKKLNLDSISLNYLCLYIKAVFSSQPSISGAFNLLINLWSFGLGSFQHQFSLAAIQS